MQGRLVYNLFMWIDWEIDWYIYPVCRTGIASFWDCNPSFAHVNVVPRISFLCELEITILNWEYAKTFGGIWEYGSSLGSYYLLPPSFWQTHRLLQKWCFLFISMETTTTTKSTVTLFDYLANFQLKNTSFQQSHHH